MALSSVALAIDIGGTKVAAGLVGARGELLSRQAMQTKGYGDGDALFADLCGLIDSVLGEGRAPNVCGVGCGGPMSPGGEEVSPLNIPAWRGFPLRARLEDHLGLPQLLDNDAKAVALGEGWVGAAAGVDNFIGMVVSTGVGGGIVLDGRLLEGAAGNAGHIGHVIVEPDGRRCACGANGCLEAHASGPSIEAIAGVPAPDVSEAVRVQTGTYVGRAVASVANLLDLQLAVVAGSVALGYGEVFFAASQDEIDRRARLDFSLGTRIVPAALGDAAPLVGAAAIARDLLP